MHLVWRCVSRNWLMKSVLSLFSSYCVFVMTEVFRESDKLRVLTFKIRDNFVCERVQSYE